MATRKRVAVVGTGTVGSQAACRLAFRGADVVSYDRFAPAMGDIAADLALEGRTTHRTTSSPRSAAPRPE